MKKRQSLKPIAQARHATRLTLVSITLLLPSFVIADSTCLRTKSGRQNPEAPIRFEVVTPTGGADCGEKFVTISKTADGATGPKGLIGQSGDASSEPGVQGIAGDTGPTGDQGMVGDDGVKGETGPTGSNGSSGPEPQGSDNPATIAVVGAACSTSPTANGTFFCGLRDVTATTTETEVTTLVTTAVSSCTMYIYNNRPASFTGTMQTYKLRKNLTDTSLTCDVSSSTRVCSATGAITFDVDDTISISRTSSDADWAAKISLVCS
jgi:hypothetical protein